MITSNRSTRHTFTLGVLLLALFPLAASAAIVPTIEKTRAADGSTDVCAAPCGVHFDATATTWSAHTAEEVALDLDYRWSFNDPSCSSDGVFAASGESCNTATGFVAAHLFETPGTYNVTLCVTGGSETECTTTPIVVSDPDVVYSGTNTICVSTNDNHAGCPSGALRLDNQSDFTSALNGNVAAGKRVLFHRGQTFTSSSSFRFTQQHRNILIGAYGSGAKPRVSAPGVTLFLNTCDGLGQLGPSPVDTRIIDLEVNNGASLLRLEDPALQLTVAHVGLTGTWAGSEFGQIFQWRDQINYCENGNSPAPADQWFLVENDHASLTNPTGRAVSMTATRSAMLGNTFRNAQDHVVRWRGMTRNILSHNRWIGRPSSGLHQLKYHAGGIADGNFGGVNAYSIVSDNRCDGNATWAFTLGQQGGPDERAEFVLVERNYMRDTDGIVQIFVRVDADRSRFSDNICEQRVAGVDGIVCGNFSLRESWPVVGRHRANGNKLYDRVAHSFQSTTVLLGIGSGNFARDNIVYAPNSSGTQLAVSGLGTCAPGGCTNNRDTSDFVGSPFVSDDPDSIEDYVLASGSPPPAAPLPPILLEQ